MNERIQELYEQSRLGPGLGYDVEKFAELIIQECLDVLDPENDLTSMREEYGRVMCMNLLRRHFSVED